MPYTDVENHHKKHLEFDRAESGNVALTGRFASKNRDLAVSVAFGEARDTGRPALARLITIDMASVLMTALHPLGQGAELAPADRRARNYEVAARCVVVRCSKPWNVSRTPPSCARRRKEQCAL